MASRVYTVNEAEFTVEGEKYDVSTFSMLLATNAIPTYVIGIAPQKNGTDAGGKTQVHPLSLSDLTKTYEDLQQKAARLAPCDLNLSLRTKENGVAPLLDTAIDLKGWLLTGVGMSPVTTTGAFSLTCSVSHPAYKLTLDLGALSVVTGVLDIARFLTFENPLEASKNAVQACIEMNDGEPGQKVIEKEIDVSEDCNRNLKIVLDQLAERLNTLKDNIGQYLAWDTGEFVAHSDQLPGQSQLQNIYPGVKHAIVSDWVSCLGYMSYWSALTSRINPCYGMEVLPTFDREQLTLCPAFPWKDTEAGRIEVSDLNTYSVVLPSQDTDPIYGCVAQVAHLVPAGGLITVWASGDEKTATIPAQIAYVPKEPENSTGRISRIRIPDWITTARLMASRIKHTNGVIKPGTAYDEGTLSMPVQSGSGENKQLKDLEPGAMMHLANTFMLDYKKSVIAELRCPFFLGIDGKRIIPGQRLKFVTGEDQTPLFYGTIGAVRHTISCAASSASTVILLSHCTFADSSDGQIIGDPVKAPYYIATGKIEW